MLDDICCLETQLPEDIEKAKWCGDFARAGRLIAQRLQNPKTPAFLRERLALEQEILLRLPLDYCYSEPEALRLIRKDIPDFTEDELLSLEDSGAVDWIYREGKPYLSRRFYETLLKVHPDISRRAGIKEADTVSEKQLLSNTLAWMKEKGSDSWHIRLKASLAIDDQAFRPGELLKVHLPLPKEAENMRNVKLLACSPEAFHISAPDAPQRTAYFECTPDKNIPFTVEYEYDACVTYTMPDAAQVSSAQPNFCTEEQSPHIVFTPTIRKLCTELSGGETNPLLLARQFYKYCTEAVTYSYMREYFTILQIPEYAALNQKGDCGVQALLFITLCRCAGIPARWQSGLFVTPYSQGCHDWAQFYIAPYGWLFADPSFGGSGYRSGNFEKQEHYFGNLDPFRMVANSEFQKAFDPPKMQLRSDPYDNLKGEAEYDGHGLLWNELEASWELLEMRRNP